MDDIKKDKDLEAKMAERLDVGDEDAANKLRKQMVEPSGSDLVGPNVGVDGRMKGPDALIVEGDMNAPGSADHVTVAEAAAHRAELGYPPSDETRRAAMTDLRAIAKAKKGNEDESDAAMRAAAVEPATWDARSAKSDNRTTPSRVATIEAGKKPYIEGHNQDAPATNAVGLPGSPTDTHVKPENMPKPGNQTAPDTALGGEHPMGDNMPTREDIAPRKNQDVPTTNIIGKPGSAPAPAPTPVQTPAVPAPAPAKLTPLAPAPAPAKSDLAPEAKVTGVDSTIKH